MTRTAWFCPSCQKHHGPHVDTCPGIADAIADRRLPNTTDVPWQVRPPIVPPRVTYFIPQDDPCAGCSGACGNIVCPKRAQILSGPVYISGAVQ